MSSFLLVSNSNCVQKFRWYTFIYTSILYHFLTTFLDMTFCAFQSLVIWSALPVICLLLTLVIFLFYFCYRCCQRDSGHHKSTSCLRCFMVFFVLLAWYMSYCISHDLVTNFLLLTTMWKDPPADFTNGSYIFHDS